MLQSGRTLTQVAKEWYITYTLEHPRSPCVAQEFHTTSTSPWKRPDRTVALSYDIPEFIRSVCVLPLLSLDTTTQLSIKSKVEFRATLRTETCIRIHSHIA